MTLLPFYIGTYTSGTSRGIHRSELSLEDGTMTAPQLAIELDNPTFLCLHPKLDVLYAVSEVRRDGKREHARLVALKITADGKLEELSALPAGGEGPCFVSGDRAGEFVFVANYSSGSVSAFAIDTEGKLQQLTSNIQHVGSSVNPDRQAGPHAHCIMMDPSDKFVCAVDLGMDQVVIYELDRTTGALKNAENPFLATPGFGPRHLAFHPAGKHAFVIHEMASELSVCTWDVSTGTMAEIHHIPTLPSEFSGSSSGAEVLVHPNGKFVYCSNRGDDSIAVFSFEAATGKLAPTSHTSTRGKTPRNFRIDPTGNYLLAQNQDSHSVYCFRIDLQTGGLSLAGTPIEVGSPCCIKFMVH